MKDYPTLDTFLAWSTEKVAEIVHANGPKVCVFPINGTRRWFMLEFPEEAARDNVWERYMQIVWQRQIELYKLFFDHGIDTLLTPVFGPDLLERGEKYKELIEPGLLWLSQNQELFNFYDLYDVRVKVYGDVARCLAQSSYSHVTDTFEELAKQTAFHKSHRLFFGICAHDATETIARISVEFYLEHGHLPNKHQIVKTYYGEYVPPADIFIGFDRPTVFDMPLIGTGEEDLYFTVGPSPYVDEHTLRAILYDHLFVRRVDDTDYDELSTREWHTLKEFYKLNLHHVLGLGCQDKNNKYWYPTPQVKLPIRTKE